MMLGYIAVPADAESFLKGEWHETYFSVFLKRSKHKIQEEIPTLCIKSCLICTTQKPEVQSLPPPLQALQQIRPQQPTPICKYRNRNKEVTCKESLLFNQKYPSYCEGRWLILISNADLMSPPEAVL